MTLAEQVKASGMSHQEFIDTKPFPKIVLETLNTLGDMIRSRGYKAADLYHSKALNPDGDDLLSCDELTAILKRVAPSISAAQVCKVLMYLDANGNGQLDQDELESSLRRARREAAPRDRMTKLAEMILEEPQIRAEVLRMPTNAALHRAHSRSKQYR